MCALLDLAGVLYGGQVSDVEGEHSYEILA